MKFQKLTKAEMKSVLGGKVQYSCTATTSCCGTISYSTDSYSSAQAWFNFYSAAGDSPSCTTANQP